MFLSGLKLKAVNAFATIIIITTAMTLIPGCDTSKKAVNSAGGWYSNHEWLKGLKLMPHTSVNQQEFSRQYHANSKWWDEAFEYLKTHDLQSLKAGTYTIDSNNVIATVSELSPKEKDKVNFEAHRDFNDLQYIITGKTQMGVSPFTNPDARITVPYSKEKDTETFSIDKGAAYYNAEPGTFFIFSPKDIHRPAFKLEGYETIKKIVIKVRVP